MSVRRGGGKNAVYIWLAWCLAGLRRIRLLGICKVVPPAGLHVDSFTRMSVWTAISILTAGAWAAWWFFRLRPGWLRPDPLTIPRPSVETSLRIVIPARNEAAELPGLLAALAGEGPAGTEVVVADDGSSDGTADRAREAAASDPRIRTVACPPAPAGWTGKTWAMTRGAEGAAADWLLFCDADLFVAGGTLDAVLAYAREQDLDAVSVVPAMPSRCFTVNLLVACAAVSRALLFRPAVPGKAGFVQGAFLLVRRSAYASIGGYAAVRASVTEDAALGRRLAEAGFRVRTVPRSDRVGATMYEDLEESVRGMERFSFALLQRSLVRAAGAVLLHVVLFLLPWIALAVTLSRAYQTAAPAHAAAAAAVLVLYACCLPLVRAAGLPIAAGLLLPLSYFGAGAVLVRSVRAHRAGRVGWKGRWYETQP